MICWYWILLLVCRPEPQSCSLSPILRGPPGKFLTLWTRSRRSHYLYIQILYDVFWRLSPLIFNLIFLPNTEGQHDGEHGVGPARLGVHVGGGHRPRLVPLLHQILYFHRIGHGLHPTTLHIGTQDFVLPDNIWIILISHHFFFLPNFQATLFRCISQVQQVKYLFIVYFHVAHLNICLENYTIELTDRGTCMTYLTFWPSSLEGISLKSWLHSLGMIPVKVNCTVSFQSWVRMFGVKRVWLKINWVPSSMLFKQMAFVIA